MQTFTSAVTPFYEWTISCTFISCVCASGQWTELIWNDPNSVYFSTVTVDFFFHQSNLPCNDLIYRVCCLSWTGTEFSCKSYIVKQQLYKTYSYHEVKQEEKITTAVNLPPSRLSSNRVYPWEEQVWPVDTQMGDPAHFSAMVHHK